MTSFKFKRVSGADLAAQLSPATVHLPAAVPARQKPPPVVQVNFKASDAFADLIAREAEKAGSTRRFFARLMRSSGFEVPEVDVNPPDNRRRCVGG